MRCETICDEVFEGGLGGLFVSDLADVGKSEGTSRVYERKRVVKMIWTYIYSSAKES